MIGIIAAVSLNGVIGKDNAIPWAGKFPGDLRRFKEVTSASTVIMGRKTWESMGARPLPGRRNIVITGGRTIDAADTCGSLMQAVHVALEDAYGNGDVWLIGGARVYEAGLEYADVIDLTHVPVDVPEGEGTVFFPFPDLATWVNGAPTHHPYNAELMIERYTRRVPR